MFGPALTPCVLCRQPLSSISGPPAQQSKAPKQAARVQQGARDQPQQHASQQAVQPQHPPQQHHGSQQQGQQQHRVRREDENSVVVRGTRYTKLECVGRGGSSKVASLSVTLRHCGWDSTFPLLSHAAAQRSIATICISIGAQGGLRKCR